MLLLLWDTYELAEVCKNLMKCGGKHGALLDHSSMLLA